MKIENNCLVTEHCTYPFDEIELVGEVFEEYFQRLKENNLADTPGSRIRSANLLGRFSFYLRVSESCAKETNTHANSDGLVFLLPSADESQVRECWNAINEYKQLPKPKTVKKPKVIDTEA